MPFISISTWSTASKSGISFDGSHWWYARNRHKDTRMHNCFTFIVTSSMPSATMILIGGTSLSEFMYRSWTARKEFLTNSNIIRCKCEGAYLLQKSLDYQFHSKKQSWQNKKIGISKQQFDELISERKALRESEIWISIDVNIRNISIFTHADSACIFTCSLCNIHGWHLGVYLTNAASLWVWIMQSYMLSCILPWKKICW